MEARSLFLLVLGLLLLIAGAELLVRGSTRLAALLGIAPLVVGLTVVAFGTSAPEMAVSVMAGARGSAELALGNVVGSNIFNVLFILGLSALCVPLVVARQVIRRDVPLVIGASGLLWLMAIDGLIGTVESLVLLAGILAYTTWSIRSGRAASAGPSGEDADASPAGREAAGRSPPLDPLRRARTTSHPEEEGGEASDRGVLVPAGFVLLGIGLLVLGSKWLVDGAVAIAMQLGVDEVVIGLTLVAAGTSLPEAATSLVAALRGERDIAVGNVVGSNLFNILAILGVAGIVSGGLHVPATTLGFDIPVMVAVAVACLPIFFTGYRIARWEGALFLAYYVAYTVYLVLASIQHTALDTYREVMWIFVLPLTAITLLVLGWRALQSDGRIADGVPRGEV